jgi:hypothetical protein
MKAVLARRTMALLACCLLVALLGAAHVGCAPSAAPATLAPVVAPRDLVFEAGVTAQSFEVSEASAGTARTLYLWTQGFDGASADWISSVTPATVQTNGLTPVEVDVAVDRTALSAGAYEGGIVVSTAPQAAGAGERADGDGTAAVTVFAIVGDGDDLSDPLAVTPTQRLLISSDDSTTVTLTVPYNGSPWTWGATVDWISGVSPDGGNAWPPPSEGAPPETVPVTITVDRTGLASGIYEGWVWFYQETFVMVKVTLAV